MHYIKWKTLVLLVTQNKIKSTKHILWLVPVELQSTVHDGMRCKSLIFDTLNRRMEFFR